jgi:hypothetical protein
MKTKIIQELEKQAAKVQEYYDLAKSYLETKNPLFDLYKGCYNDASNILKGMIKIAEILDINVEKFKK